MTHTLYQAAGIAIVVFIFWQIKLRLSRGRKFSDFIIGDDGKVQPFQTPGSCMGNNYYVAPIYSISNCCNT